MLRKVDDKLYSWYTDHTLFVGSYFETVAYGYWIYGIPKETIVKGLNSLVNIGSFFPVK